MIHKKGMESFSTILKFSQHLVCLLLIYSDLFSVIEKILLNVSFGSIVVLLLILLVWQTRYDMGLWIHDASCMQ